MRTLYSHIPIILILLFAASCTIQDKEIETMPETTIPIEDAKTDPRGTYPEIMGASIPKLRPNATPWESSDIFCSDNPKESFYQIRVIENKGEISYIVFSSTEEKHGFRFYFNEFDGMGQLMSRHELRGADYSIIDKTNLQRSGDYVLYFTNLEKQRTKYFSLSTGEHGDTTASVIDWELHTLKNFAADFTSPSNSLVITLYDTWLVLRDLTDKSFDTLINQEYRGSWSFGQGCWNDESTKFYFDNSGAVACIWELDVEKKALNKIVPEHYADHPFYFRKDGTEYIAYCQNNCIKLATVVVKN